MDSFHCDTFASFGRSRTSYPRAESVERMTSFCALQRTKRTLILLLDCFEQACPGVKLCFSTPFILSLLTADPTRDTREGNCKNEIKICLCSVLSAQKNSAFFRQTLQFHTKIIDEDVVVVEQLCGCGSVLKLWMRCIGAENQVITLPNPGCIPSSSLPGDAGNAMVGGSVGVAAACEDASSCRRFVVILLRCSQPCCSLKS